MADIVDARKRSEMMANIRGRNTAPELAVRRIAHRMGLRFRLHRNDLPGRPDLVLPKHRLVVFVHGCFWHRHEGCRHASIPKARRAFWMQKLMANVARDQRQQATLQALGWRVLVIWGCETGNRVAIEQKLAALTQGNGYPRNRRRSFCRDHENQASPVGSARCDFVSFALVQGKCHRMRGEGHPIR